jgi:DNA polymerase-3 subunit epsilon
VSALRRLFGRDAALSDTQRKRLEAWTSLHDASLSLAMAEARLVVVDVEATGLDPRRDRLIAVGAVVIERLRIDFGQAFYTVLRQPEASSTENILVHGIGGTAQRAGVPPADGLLDFLLFAGKAPLVAFHAGFDEAMLRRAVDVHLGITFKPTWIDLAQVAPEALPGEMRRRKALDDWLELYGIPVFNRHDAVADALATAQLFLALQAPAEAAGLNTLERMRWHPDAGRWTR